VPWKGRLTVYLLPDAAALKSFIRQIEKRSPRPKTGVAIGGGEAPHVAVAMGVGGDNAPETVASLFMATVLIQNRAKTEQLPEWLTGGFARTTVAQGVPATARKRAAAKLNLPVTAAWNADMPSEKEIWCRPASPSVSFMAKARTLASC
jgi:hypothetical protein